MAVQVAVPELLPAPADVPFPEAALYPGLLPSPDAAEILLV